MEVKLDLLPWQWDFLHSTKLVNALSGASDTGKSFIARIRMMLNSIQIPGRISVVTATTYMQAELAILEKMIDWLKASNIPHRAIGLRSRGEIIFPNGSRILCFAAGNIAAVLKSQEISEILIEEASEIPEIHIGKLVFESERRLRNMPPPLALLICTNPKTKTCWLYRNIFDKALEDDDLFVVHMDFFKGYKRNDKKYLATLQKQPKHERDRYLHGLWGAVEGQAFPITEKMCHPIAPDKNSRWHITFDYGLYPDPMVYILIENKGACIVVRDVLVLRKKTVPSHEALLKPWFDKYNISQATGDTSAGSGEVREMLRKNFNCQTYQTNKNRTLGAGRLFKLLAHDLIRFDSPAVLDVINSLECMLWVNKQHKVDVEGEFDDPYDALRYYIMCALYWHNAAVQAAMAETKNKKYNIASKYDREGVKSE